MVLIKISSVSTKARLFLLVAKASEHVISMTRLGNLLHFGQPFKAFGKNKFAQISHIVRQSFVKVSKFIIFQVKSILGNFF